MSLSFMLSIAFYPPQSDYLRKPQSDNLRKPQSDNLRKLKVTTSAQ